MDFQKRNNVTVAGNGATTMVFAHGFGCDQSMWRYLLPAFAERYTTVVFDLVGSGGSDLGAYELAKYASLQGYADDLLEIITQFADGPVIFVGHSVSAMVGLLAANARPERFLAQIMVGPSPCYINDGAYHGGFSRADIDDLLDTMEGNYLGWSSTMAPAIMGVPERPELGAELTNSFCRTDPHIAQHFARTTFLSDHRAELSKSTVPALILQSTNDMIAPLAVGQYMLEHMPHGRLALVENDGHCPHMSAPDASVTAMNEFLATLN